MKIEDIEFIAKFENLSLDPMEFNHLGHLRIAWLYLNHCELEEAIVKVTSGIFKYASNLGAPDKFRHTLTAAIVRIIAKRLTASGKGSFSDFIKNNQDLLDDLPGVLNMHYSHAVLYSDEAKKVYVQPDRTPL